MCQEPAVAEIEGVHPLFRIATLHNKQTVGLWNTKCGLVF